MAILNQKIKEQFEKTVSDEKQKMNDKLSVFFDLRRVILENMEALEDINETLIACDKTGMKLDIPSDIFESGNKYSYSIDNGKFKLSLKRNANDMRLSDSFQYSEHTISIEMTSEPNIRFYVLLRGMTLTPMVNDYSFPLIDKLSSPKYDYR